MNTVDRHAICMATGQTNAEVMDNKSPTLVAGHEQPIVTHPQIAGTLCASGAGLSPPCRTGERAGLLRGQRRVQVQGQQPGRERGLPGGNRAHPHGGTAERRDESLCDRLLPLRRMLSGNPKSGFYEADTSRTLDLNGGNPCCHQGGMAIVEDAEVHAAAVDCRNLREMAETSGTLLAKASSGGYSLNYQNPVRTRLCVRRLTPTEAERLQGYPDGWTEFGAEGKPVSDTRRYQMLGNSVAVPLRGVYHAGNPVTPWAAGCDMLALVPVSLRGQTSSCASTTATTSPRWDTSFPSASRRTGGLPASPSAAGR